MISKVKGSPTVKSKTEIFSQVAEAIQHAKHCCDLWWLLEGKHEKREMVVSAFQDFALVYETIRPALYTCFIIKLCTQFGGENDVTLKSLNGAEADSQFVDLWDKGRRLYKYRNKVIAHLDKRTDADTVAKDTGFTNDGLRQFMNDVCSFFDRLAVKNGENELAVFDVDNEFSEILKILEARQSAAE